VSAASSPALIIHFTPGTTAADRDRLVALLADYDLIAIQEGDMGSPPAWTAHFASAEARNAAAEAIGAIADGDSLRLELAEIEDDDWAKRTQADLPAIRVGRIIVAPPWDRPDAEAARDAVVVEIEPSRGFGTGHHQSTRLCLVLLQNRPLGSGSVLDVGTGSGVLAIVAAKLGAPFVSAIDVDPDAIENARENIVRNSVAQIVEAHVRDLTQPGVPAADLVTANLTGTLLARHAPELGALVKPGGSLIVAGFTVDEKPLVLDAFEATFAVAESAEEEGWWAFVLARP
jgi:ribosomal protein L11 methyltransferase